MIKILTYVSKINKNDKEIKKLNDTCMRNIKISFEEKENKEKYEEYFFHYLSFYLIIYIINIKD